MKHATLEDFVTIRKLFDAHLDIFPYLRNDTLREKIEGIGGSVVFEDNVVIIYLRYMVRKTIGNARANVGDVIIHELVKGEGGNAKDVIQRFFEYVGSPVWTTVRRDNNKAKQFYEKVGMKRVGAILWQNGELEGDVYRTDSLEKFLA